MGSGRRLSHYRQIFFILIALSVTYFFVAYLRYFHHYFTSYLILKRSSASDNFIIYRSVTKLNSTKLEVISEGLDNDVAKSFYENRKNWNTSKLGAILFKNEPYPVLSGEQANKTYLILVYKQWNFLQKRHLFNFGKIRKDPLEYCSVKNCVFTGNSSDLTTADAVIIHLFATGAIPDTKERKPQQRWIFLDDEAPRSTIKVSRTVNISEMHNLFNWSMTYRTTSDIPVPYGRTIPLKNPIVLGFLSDLIPNWSIKRTDYFAAILISNCGVPYRNKAIESLQKYLGHNLHVYGKCGKDKELKKSCPGHFKAECEVMSKYLFYIVLENSKCKEYITEKIFYHAYSKGSIPVIQGPSKEECEELLPPNSYLHLDNFKSIEQLVKKMLEISLNNEVLLYYHQWRFDFEVLNEHGYFGSKSYHLCRVCEAMNYNDNRTTMYSEQDLKLYLDQTSLCRMGDELHYKDHQ